MDQTFEDYVADRGHALLRFSYLLSGNLHTAEDLVQEVLGRAFLRWRRMAEVEQPDAYLRTAIVREYLSWRRRRASGEALLGTVPEPAESTADDRGAARLADRDEMWSLLGTLPRRQRAVLVLRYYEDLPDTRIAEVLGCRTGTVRVHASRGLSHLRRLLEPSRSSAVTPSAAELIGGDR
jgi:RNA polymerase sigma-70 factor (sigma-E family)